MSRVVLDTNVYISALLFGGLPGAFLDLPLSRSFTLIISAVLLDELDEKLTRKFDVSAKNAALIRSRLESVADVVQPSTALNVIVEDPDDNRVLECAVEGGAEVIVTGDRHLLGLAEFQGISIVTVRQFLESSEMAPEE